MRGKPVLLFLAMICGAITATGAGRLAREAEASSPKRTVEILVAVRQLCSGANIPAERLALVNWSSETVPTGALSSLRSLEGLVPKDRIEAGEPVLLEHLVEADAFEPQSTPTQAPASTAEPAETTEPVEPVESVESVATSEAVVMPLETQPAEMSPPSVPEPVVVPRGYSVVSLLVDESVGLAHPLQPRDRVNVAAYFPATEQLPQASVRELFRGVEVFAIQDKIGPAAAVRPGGTVAPSAISLLIPSGAETAWTLASELGQIRLSLAATTETAPHADGGLARSFVRWIEDRQTVQTKAFVSLAKPEPADDRSQGFRMTKVHGDDWTEYEIPSPGRSPVVVGSSRPANRSAAEPAGPQRTSEQRPTPATIRHRTAESPKAPTTRRME